MLGAAVGQYVTIVRRSECEDSEQPFAIKAARCEFTHVAHSPDTPPAFASPHHESSASAHVYVGAPVGASDGGIVGAFVSPSTVGLDVGDAVGAVGASVGSTVGLDVAQLLGVERGVQKFERGVALRRVVGERGELRLTPPDHPFSLLLRLDPRRDGKGAAAVGVGVATAAAASSFWNSLGDSS